MRGGIGRAFAVWACGCAIEPDDIGAGSSAVTGAEASACVDPEAILFAWEVVPPLPAQVDSPGAWPCMLGQVARDGDAVRVPLVCTGEDGPSATTLVVSGSPQVPTAGFKNGAAATLEVVAGEGGAWVRLATAEGKLLVVGAAATSLAPPDAASWWSPFVALPAATTCLADETACDLRRGGVDLRRSGGAPRVVLDAGAAIVGDKGEAQAWVATAWSQDAACAGGPATWFVAGIVAAR